MNVDKNFDRAVYAGERLKHFIRINAVYNTQEKFAEGMGVDVRTVRRWYKRFDSLYDIRLAADLLGISDYEILVKEKEC